MPFDPYWEWFKIPPDRRPPSRRELLGVGPDETDLKKIEEAAQRRREHLKQFVISPQEEVALHSRRLLVEVAEAVVALRQIIATTGQDDRQPGAARFEAEIVDGTSDQFLPVPIIIGPAEGQSPGAVEDQPPLVAEIVSESAGTLAPARETPYPVPPPIPVAASAAHVAGAGPAPPPPSPPDGEDGEVFIGGSVAEEWLPDEGYVMPLPYNLPPSGKRVGLLRLLREATSRAIGAFAAGAFRLSAAGPRAIFRGVAVLARRIDAMLRLIAGEENAILHGFLRVLAIMTLAIACALAGPPLVAGLAKLASALVSSRAGTPQAEPKETIETSPQKVFTNSLGMKLVLVPAGEFMMGSPDSEPDAHGDEKPQHRVEITHPFYLGAYEVTVAQFRKFVEVTGYQTDAERAAPPAGTRPQTWRDPGFKQEDDHPVACVTWNDAAKFCQWLSDKAGMTYRLPTEAEWEYACRAGTTTPYSFGDDPASLKDYAWVEGEATHPVGKKKPNPWGLYDVHGNVEEWCADWYNQYYYANSPGQDPTGPSDGTQRVVRGVHLTDARRSSRSAYRFVRAPDQCEASTGFRVVCEPAEGTPAGPAAKGPEHEAKAEGQGAAGTPATVARPATPHVIGETSKVITNSIEMKLVLIQAGEFTMGSDEGRSDERPPHRVRISKPFYLGMYEVTQAEYERVIGSNPAHFRGSSQLPVEDVSWEDAQEFCRRLSAIPEERTAGRVYRLPTEAEWEYACRAGSMTKYSFGDDDKDLAESAWFESDSDGRTHAVGQKKPNAWGLYDVHGNVCEWCADWYDGSYYTSSPPEDPAGPASGPYRVLRGGSWNYDPGDALSSNRGRSQRVRASHNEGFRVAMTTR